MIRSGIVFLGLIACAGAAHAELTVQELEQQPFMAEVANLFPLGQGDLLLRMRGQRERRTQDDLYFEPWSVVYQLAQDGKVKAQAELPYGAYQFVVPYLNGFAVQRLATDGCAPRCSFGGSEPVQIVAFERVTDTQPQLLYEPGKPPFHTTQLYAAPDGQDLYVMEIGPDVTQITRIDATGQIAAQTKLGWLESSSFMTIDDGAVFVQYAGERSADMELRAIDRNGRPRWQTRIPMTRGYEAIYSPAGFITLPTFPESPQDRGKQRLLNFDTRTGELVADVLVQPYAYLTGTRYGLLMAGPMLGQSYVGMVGRDGKFAWLRRYVADEKIGDIQRAATTPAGDLMFVTLDRYPKTTTPTTSIVVTDSKGASFAAARGGCLEPKWQQSLDLATQLQRRGLWVQAPKSEDLGSRSQGCSDREHQFITFMQALAAVVPPGAAKTSEWTASRQEIAVRLTAAGGSLRLEQYSADRSHYPSAGVRLSFVAPYDRAAEFWKIVATQVQPHLERMKDLDERFVNATGFQYVVNERGDLDYAQTLAQLEKAARTVDEKIMKIPPAQLADVRKTPPRGWVLILIRLEGFGGGDGALYPFDVADRTFLELVADHRRRAARGEIVIRD